MRRMSAPREVCTVTKTTASASASTIRTSPIISFAFAKCDFSAGVLHQVSRASKERVRAGADDHSGHLAFLHDRAGIHFVAGLLGDGQRFAGKRGLVGVKVIAVEQPQVGGNHVAQADANDVAGHQRAGQRPIATLPSRKHLGLLPPERFFSASRARCRLDVPG